MSTTTKNLTESAARRLPKASTKAKDLYQIEGHLWLQHTGEAMSFLYMVNAKALQKSRIEVGLGSWQVEGESNLAEGRVTRTWADARARTAELDAELKKGNHPRDIEQAFRAAMKAKPVVHATTNEDPRNPPKAKQRTVRQLLIEFVTNSANAQEWLNPKTSTDFQAAVKTYVYPLIGDRLVHTITSDDIFAVLTQPKNGTTLWRAITVQAKVTRQRLERMFAYARAENYRRSDDESNPAAWTHFEHRLPKASKVHVVKAHPHVKPESIADVFATLKGNRKSLAAQALTLKMLTVPRTSALIAAKWEEFDLDHATWTIPGERMKGDLQTKQNDFVIPLSTAALEVIKGLPSFKTRKGYVFPAHASRKNKVEHIGPDSMNSLLRRTGFTGVLSPHGIRHTFSTWRADHTEFASEVAEACLAHANGEGNQVAKVYNRGTYLNRRREVMEAWGAYVTTAPTPANVVDINEKKRTRHAA